VEIDSRLVSAADQVAAQERVTTYLSTKDLKMNGIELIAKERQRQIEEEGWSANHDDLHSNFQLSKAAIAYLNPSNSDHVREFWPWDWKWWKPARASMDVPYDVAQIRNLVKAGALIAAEIDRLQRLKK